MKSAFKFRWLSVVIFGFLTTVLSAQVADVLPPPVNEVRLTGSTSWQPRHIHTLWYTAPAKVWMTSALPLGNGQFGACVMGGVRRDEIQFNEKTLWRGHLGSVVNHASYGSYLDFGHLFITDTDSTWTEASDYRRWLDMEEACAGVAYRVGESDYSREYLVSFPDRVLAVRYSVSGKGRLNKRITLFNANGTPPVYEINADGHGVASFAGEVERTGTEKNEAFYCTMTVVVDGGTVSTDRHGGLVVCGANELTVYLSGGTNFSPDNDDYVSDAALLPERVALNVSEAVAKGYETIRANHVADYRALYDRCRLNISTQNNNQPTPALIAAFAKNPDKNLLLEQLYFSYGRYLMIASSRGVDLPSNLQGIWNNSNSPAWNSDIHSNINVQMNYWLAETTNLSELHLPFLNYIYREACERPQWRRNAWEIGGQTRGWTLTTENNIYGSGSNWMQNYTIANAWYCLHLWQHYQYTLDTDYLWRTALPAMKSCCEYWMERLVLAADGTYECPDEYSPEHGPDKEHATAHAQQLVWSLFHHTLEGYEEYVRRTGNQLTDSNHAPFLEQLKKMFVRLDAGLATETIDGEQLLREWKYTSQRDVKTYNSHRHLSHLIALYPGDQISEEKDSSLFRAAVNSLNKRGDASTGWSMGWKVNCFARAKDGERCQRLLVKALQLQTNTGFSEHGGIYENLWDAHTPFQIDGNFGATAGMAEMLLQSHSGKLEILPALPSAWAFGRVSGLRAIGNFEVTIRWENHKVLGMVVNSNSGEPLTIKYPHISDFYITDMYGNLIVPTIINAHEITFPTQKGNQYIFN